MTEPADAPEWLERDVFFVSDGTGITAETLGQSVLAQFDRLRVRVHRISFVDNPDKAREAVTRINDVANRHGSRPIVFSTLVDSKTNESYVVVPSAIYDRVKARFEEAEDEALQKAWLEMATRNRRAWVRENPY